MVLVANTSNGERWRTTTGAGGRYFLEYLTVGGPYRIEVRAVGFEPAVRDSVFLRLGQRLTTDFTLAPAVVQLEEITVTGLADPMLSAARTGPAQVFPDSLIARLPLNVRAYTELALLSPQVTISSNGGLSFSGQHDRYNSIQVDGATNNDFFGSAASGNGTPGWAVGLNSFTPEAVKELQVLTAPFDVRYGNFAGGLINAVTRSGSNRVEGSVLGYLEGSGISGDHSDDFTSGEFGFTFGAPIARDRVALFLDAAVRRQVFPQYVVEPGSDTTGVGIRHESLVRFQDLLRRHGVDPGTFSAGAFRAPTRNLFAKVTAQLGVNSRLELSHNYGHGNAQNRTGERGYDLYALSSNGRETPRPSMRRGWRGRPASAPASRTSCCSRGWTTGGAVFPTPRSRRSWSPPTRGSCWPAAPSSAWARDRVHHLGADRQLRRHGGKPPAYRRDPRRADRSGGRRAAGAEWAMAFPQPGLPGARRSRRSTTETSRAAPMPRSSSR